MTLNDLQPSAVADQTAEDLRRLIRETPDFTVPENLDALLKAEIVKLVIEYIKNKKAPDPTPPTPPEPTPPAPPVPPVDAPPADQDLSAEEALAELRAMGFKTREDAMSMLKAIGREKAMVGHERKALEERKAAVDKREVELKGLEKWIDKKKGELEALVADKKRLIAVIEQARAQGIKF